MTRAPIHPLMAQVQATLADLNKLERYRKELTREVAMNLPLDRLRVAMFTGMLGEVATVAGRVSRRMTTEATR